MSLIFPATYVRLKSTLFFRNDLTSIHPDDIYVIGGIVDRGSDRAPLTLSTAKKLKIRHAR